MGKMVKVAATLFVSPSLLLVCHFGFFIFLACPGANKCNESCGATPQPPLLVLSCQRKVREREN